jgi:hypothetical protein
MFVLVKRRTQVKTIKSGHIYFAPFVLKTLFNTNFDVVMSAVRVESSPK